MITDRSWLLLSPPLKGSINLAEGGVNKLGGMLSCRGQLTRRSTPKESKARAKNWLLPISAERVTSQEKGNEKGMHQLNNLIKNLDIENELSISVGDSLYGTEKCRESAVKNPNLVHIFRMTNSRVLFDKPDVIFISLLHCHIRYNLTCAIDFCITKLQ